MLTQRTTLSEALTARIDRALQQERQAEPARTYLGGSRLGVACDRALQYEYLGLPVDKGQDFSGQTLRIFQAGHVFEELAIGWLQKAGFSLRTHTDLGGQFGFSQAGGRIKGHVDGILESGPEGLAYPALWECKSLKGSAWKDTVKRGLNLSKPLYAAQIALYQAYMEETVPGISQNPALFTAINKDTAELYFEAVPFNGELAQRSSDRGVNILRACDAQERLPRVAHDASHFSCKWCPWHQRCWGGQG